VCSGGVLHYAGCFHAMDAAWGLEGHALQLVCLVFDLPFGGVN
jgi:hypothetical protein